MKNKISWLVLVIGFVGLIMFDTGCATGYWHRDGKRSWTTPDGGLQNRSDSLTISDPLTAVAGVMGKLVEVNVNTGNGNANYGAGSYCDYGHGGTWCQNGKHLENWNGQLIQVQNGRHLEACGQKPLVVEDGCHLININGGPVAIRNN